MRCLYNISVKNGSRHRWDTQPIPQKGHQADKNAKIVVYCKSGGRSSLATQTLKKMGYADIASMAGGWMAWEKAGYPVE